MRDFPFSQLPSFTWKFGFLFSYYDTGFGRTKAISHYVTFDSWPIKESKPAKLNHRKDLLEKLSFVVTENMLCTFSGVVIF